ncbi:hypothetical protein SprV_0602148000 [Sparganum proliferum]
MFLCSTTEDIWGDQWEKERARDVVMEPPNIRVDDGGDDDDDDDDDDEEEEEDKEEEEEEVPRGHATE